MGQSDTQRYDFIDALRGFAILGVVFVHAMLALGPRDPTLAWLAREGSRGVQLFFVVSALALCLSWAARHGRERSPVRNFFIRRLFRVAPLFYVGIAGYAWAYGFAPSYWAPNGIEWWFIPVTAAFLHGFHPETFNSIVPGGWSIATEMSFYLIAPLLFARIQSSRQALAFLAFSLLLATINHLFVPGLFDYPEDQRYLPHAFALLDFPSQLPMFALGILAYRILAQGPSRRRIAMIGGALLPFLLAGFFYPLPALSLPMNALGKLLGAAHLVIAGALCAIATVFLATWPVRLLVNRLTVMTGRLSYCMYIAHFGVLLAFSQAGLTEVCGKLPAGALLHFGLTLAATVAVSLVLQRLIETPGIALGKRLIERLEQRPASASLARVP